MHIEKLNDIVYKINNTYHRKIKMKPVNFKDSAYIGDSVKSNNKDPEFKIGDRVRIIKYENIFVKGYTPDRPEEVVVINKVKKYCFTDICFQ